MIPREAKRLVREALGYSPAVLLVGPRQVGKSTLAMEIVQQAGGVYLDLEDEQTVALLDESSVFLRQFEDRLVVLDEIHRRPELFASLRGIIDAGRRKNKGRGRFLILGSATLGLLRQTSESLTGRISYVDLLPLSVVEAGKDESARDRLWLRGGFPDSLLGTSDTDSFRVRQDLIRNCINRDVPTFGPKISPRTMGKLWRMIAHLQGSMLNATALARTLEVSARSAKSYVDLLCDLFLVRLLPPYSANIGKRLVKSPKIYVRDSGVLHALLQIVTQEQLATHPVLGKSWEGYVIENLVNALPWGHTAHYFRTAAGAEIDLVIVLPDQSLWAIEIKRSLARRVRKGFHIAREDLKPTRCFVAHSGEERMWIAEGIEAIGVGDLVREIESLSPLARK